jgi:ubiquinone/menaquinone biosynthesis C-methylase UbiE
VDNPVRRRYTQAVPDRIGIRRGERVLELGPGPGAFTVDAARGVGPEGQIIAIDIQPEMIAQVEQRIREAGLTNVETHVASAHSLPLEDESMDRAFLITVLPEIPDPARALAELHRVLRPGGVLSITEEFYDPDYLFSGETIRLVEAAGFKLIQRFGNLWIYTTNFEKVTV